MIHLLVVSPVGQSFLLAGDGVVPDEAYVEVPVMDGLVRFTGDVVLEVDRAWELIQAFLRSGQADALSEWQAL
ncbi:hypothetical protein Acy02nite_51910 [Actinoplanes cyaneus]|uniref:Uncharacterized protein n=1 Tax=Actinoplanes cyaneus TaxID=52696 RepID=A0A919M2J0_9ACTN|nr:hypothetical protein [Actinoplanes cyaneus]MCW2141241.1 hypothetical protein [Actinoplanes cyaneus]GID67310.1 hypothetical protein Acy02nite_51910 [Actinoplanes cyaneus]